MNVLNFQVYDINNSVARTNRSTASNMSSCVIPLYRHQLYPPTPTTTIKPTTRLTKPTQQQPLAFDTCTGNRSFFRSSARSWRARAPPVLPVPLPFPFPTSCRNATNPLIANTTANNNDPHNIVNPRLKSLDKYLFNQTQTGTHQRSTQSRTATQHRTTNNVFLGCQCSFLRAQWQLLPPLVAFTS